MMELLKKIIFSVVLIVVLFLVLKEKRPGETEIDKSHFSGIILVV